MLYGDVRDYVKKVLKYSFPNINALDKFTINDEGTLLFDGKQVIKEEEIKSLSFERVDTLPEVGETLKIYLVSLDDESKSTNDECMEYIWLEDENRYEYLGKLKFEFDISNYMTPLSESEIDEIFDSVFNEQL